ncbi:fer-1 [Pristionchus pacificus]|nr:fer-1 [Pristionchus pacificus]
MPLWRSNKSKSSRSSSGGGEASGSKTSLLKKIKSKLSGSKSKMKSKVKSLKSKTDQSGPDSETDVDPSEIDDDSSHTQSTTRTRNSSFSSGESEESGRYRGGRIKKKRYKKTERDFENTDKSGVYHIMIRIIEGRDLPGVNLRVKALVDGRSESTRVSSEKDPRWRQNLSFTLNRSMEKMSDTVFELKLYSENRIARDKLHGEWNCFLGSILHQPDRAIISKWVALRRPRRDNETIVNETENVGFLRISIAIYGNNETPPPMADDESHELFSGAQLQQFTLAVRLFRLHALATRMREPWRKDRDRKSEKSQDPPYYAVRVTVGDSSAESNAESITLSEGYFVIALNREIMLPIMWPTVINKIHFALILSKGKKTRRIVARSSIRLNSIYVAGEDGFLPTFGPSFINFYGPQRVPRLKRRREKHPEKDFDEHMYYCRLLVSVDCFDTPSDDSTVAEISVDAHKFATPFEKYFKYVMCGSFFICSNIDPSFSTSSLMFLVSIGNYGSSDMHGINERSSTLATMPYYDGTKCFTIPWGNYKPLVYIPCGFDRSAFRIERINAIMKVVTLLDHYIDEARVNADQSSPEDVASITVEAIEHTCKKLDSLFNHHRSDELSTPLDFDRYQARRRMMEEMKGELVDLKFTGLKPADTVVDSMRLLCRIREWVGRMAVDDSASLPDVFIKMFADGKLIGLARIPTAKVFFSKNDALRGDLCAKLHAYPIEWLQTNAQRRKAENVPAVLHARLWVGDENRAIYWQRDIQPADQKSYLEIYQYQKKPVLGKSVFKDAGFRSITSRSEEMDMAAYTREAPTGWKYKGSWFIMNSHSMWMREEKYKKNVIDKLFELEWKPGGDPSTGWEFKSYTDYYGKTLDAKVIEDSPPDGWEFVGEGRWLPDRHSYGDQDGWCYSVSECFWGEAEMRDDRMGPMHLYRRRCLQRMRTSKEYNEKEEDLEEFLKTVRPEENWEYARDEKQFFHDDADSGDTIRRRRCLIEIARTDVDCTPETLDIPRFYEVHSGSVHKWQMRAYILWGKELLPSQKKSRVFVRVTFMDKSKETSIVEKSQHPIWNESMIFENLMIPGAQNGLKEYPPSVLVEVKGERLDDREVFLGRFYAKPNVILSKVDRRGALSWHTLHFKNQRTRGSLLACFELFLLPSSTNSKGKTAAQGYLPKLPEIKSHLSTAKYKRYEVPKDICPTFEKYSVQALFWGVRNLAKYQLLSVRRPFVEIIVGDEDAITGPLYDVTKNPNFDEPFITFESVRLPTLLHLAPPLMLNLFDSRAFKRTPLVGSCSISDFKRYIHVISKSEARSVHDYSAFDAFVDQQDEAQDGPEEAITSVHEGSGDWVSQTSDVKIDWWSKYYYSAGLPEKAPSYETSGYDQLRIYDCDLEAVSEFRGFEDFLDTFKFSKSSKGHFDDAEEKEVTGELKGKLFITKHVGGKPCLIEHPPGVEFTGPVECVVRVYVVEAKELVTPRRSGIADPYIVVRLGKQKIKLKKSYRADTTEPEFGEMVEFKATIPIEKDLTISVMDKRTLLADEEIGSTRIDLENRLLSKFRGTVGIADEFVTKGDLGWRDQMTPLKILARYCKKMLLPPPDAIYDDNKNAIGLKMLGLSFLAKDVADPKRPEMCGGPIQRIALYILHKIGIVPEHVETRVLTSHTHGGNVVCGRLRCFVDIFPVSLGLIPPSLDISLREPQPYQLRIALFYVTNAILCKRSFGKPSGDLYFKVFVNGQMKPYKTDIHYRVTDGYGSFNWRIIIDFDYNPWEKKVYMYEKKRMFKKAHRELVDPLVIIQLWDNNKFKKDGFIGEYTLNLFDIEYGKMSESEQREVTYAKEKKTCWCILGCKFMCKACIKCCCTCLPTSDMSKGPPKPVPLPRAPRYGRPSARPVIVKEPKKEEGGGAGDGSTTTTSSSDPPVSLFDMYATEGVWPMLSRTLQSEQKLDLSARKKKDDDAQTDVDYVMGCLEMELQLLTKAEADADPVGAKRKEPNHNPFLDKPDRSKWDSFWFTSRIKPALSFWWRKCGVQCMMVTIIIVFTILVVAAFIYQLSNFPFKIIGL